MTDFLVEVGEEIGIIEIHKIRREITKVGRKDQLKIFLHELIEGQEQLAIQILKEHEFSIDYHTENEKQVLIAQRKGREGIDE